ncbi:conserved hypothetical protein [Hyella patelloides LEGE 07179]|uniref:Multi-component transcriptional regulator, winged helix family n=1 Tax=Hyella patelloides LEGE 07179 TaxID=945734 RepID=A0A563VMC6_9CYAN|nr:response regulator [Hyella patelloides]VEP12614.1 conserved hypothetical protein [Hyella patelloides LEGE 07179]
MKILLVEDDKLIAQTLENILRDRHYVVDLASEGQLGWEFVETYNYDLILLDVMLPKLNGIEFCKRLRDAGNQTPVLLLTAQSSSNKKVMGLDAGADDYVVKPFEISELLARIRVLLRRRNSPTTPILQWGKLRLNSSIHEVTYDDRVLNITPKEYRLLELFIDNGDRVLTREIILDRLWAVEEAPNNNTVSAHIKDIRRKLKKAGANADFIETVYGVGYRLKPLSTLKGKRSKERGIKKEINTETQLRKQTREALTAVWQQFEKLHSDRLSILEKANLAWQKHSLEGQLLQQAQWAAHKLAGGLGIFGFNQGSSLAVEMEQLLKIQSDSDRDRARHFSELLFALKNSLKSNSQPLLTPVNQHRPVILAVDNQSQLVQQIMAEMSAVAMKFEMVTNPRATKKALVQANVDVIIWQFSLADETANTLNDFIDVINDRFPLPIILFTDNNNQDDRLKITRLTHPILLQRASIDNRAVKAIVKALQQARHKVAKVLVVDDDSQVLAAIDSLLDPLNIELTVLDNPLNFWRFIAEFKPDLLILDFAMPQLTGIELCQLVRNDPRWRELPILFLTIHNDLGTMQQILSAGANDCISKTLVQSELIPKIFNHLDRRQFYYSVNL